jgi:hypothetical protein
MPRAAKVPRLVWTSRSMACALDGAVRATLGSHEQKDGRLAGREGNPDPVAVSTTNVEPRLRGTPPPAERTSDVRSRPRGLRGRRRWSGPDIGGDGKPMPVDLIPSGPR